MTDRPSELSDEALGRYLADALPRHAAPPGLRAAVAGGLAARPARPSWLAPALAAAAAALLVLLAVVPSLPRGAPADPAQRLVRAVTSEYGRAALWGARHDLRPAALQREVGIALPRMFRGDAELTFLTAEPVYLDHRRGLALHYRDRDGHLVTYVVLRGPSPVLPERRRVQVDRFRPALLRDNGVSAWMWPQQELVCFVVTDRVAAAELDRLKDYFLRLRVATEPRPTD